MSTAVHLGVDIGGTAVKAAALDDRLALVRRSVSERYARPDAEELGRAVVAAAREALGVRPAASIGLCLPGLVNSAGDGIEYAANVPGLSGRRFLEIAAAALGGSTQGVTVAVTSDALAAAVDLCAAERLRGRLLAISLGTGVGAAVLDDGVPLMVTGRSCGHLGQIDVSLDEEPPVGPDGGAGGLEAYIGLPALRARYGGSGPEVLKALTPDEAPVRALARAIRIAHAIYRPDHVRLLGGVGIRLAGLAEGLRTRVESGLTSLARPGWTLGFGRDDWHAAAGAARFGYEQIPAISGPRVREPDPE